MVFLIELKLTRFRASIIKGVFTVINKISTGNQWRKFSKGKPNIPFVPEKYYENEWQGWGNFLGIEDFNPNKNAGYNFKKNIHLINSPTYSEAKKIIKIYKFKNQSHFKREWSKKLKIKNIPNKANIYYKDQWVSWDDFLGKK